jgi:hypothetical protein
LNVERCLEVEELADVLASGTDDPRRGHLDQCPRCQALVAEYEGFMAVDDGQAGLSTAEMARLDQTLPPAENRILRLPRWLVAVPAAAAVLALFFALPQDRPVAPDPAVMRGEVQPDTLLVPHGVKVGADGRVLFSWDPSPQADSYVVELLGGDLGELARIQTGTASVEVAPETVQKPEPTRFWRVTGFKKGDPVIRSGLREFPQ